MKDVRKILRQQLELLAEQSKSAIDDELVRLSSAMCGIHRELVRGRLTGVTLFFVVSLNLLVSIIVLIKNFFRG